MKSSKQFNPSKNIFLLLVGSPGSGKTTLALQFPRPYIFDADGNLAGPVRYLKQPDFKYDSGLLDDDDNPVAPFKRWEHMSKCLSAASQDPEIDTIIIDSLSAISDYVKDDIKRQRAMNPMAKNAPPVNEKNRGIIPLIQQEWDIYAHYFTNLVTQLKSVQKHIIITAHHEVKADDNNIMREFLCIQGRMRGQFSGMFGDVWQPFVKTSGMGDKVTYERMIRVVPTNSLDEKGVKTSLDVPPVFPNDYNYIAEKLDIKQNAQ